MGKALRNLLVVMLLLIASLSFSQAKTPPFGLNDIPAIRDRAPVHIALETAAGTASNLLPAIQRFMDKTGIKVTYEELLMSAVYPKVNMDFVSGTGAYDIVVVEASTTNEWAPYLYPVYDLAKKYDPNGVQGLEKDLAGIEKMILRAASDRNGALLGVPYYTYNMVMYVRQDVLDDPTEKKDFKAKFGYDLKAPSTYKELADFGKFFMRKKGQLLKGKRLSEDLYALGVMGGQYEINDEISARVWSQGVDWVTLERDSSGKAKGFVVTQKNRDALTFALEEFKKELTYSSPGCVSGFWDFTTAEMVAGRNLCMPFVYCSLDQWAFQVEDQVPGAKLALYPVIGKRGYTGCYHQAVSKMSKNPEAAYWLVRYLGSYECQKEMMENGGWSGVRRDIMDDPKYQTEAWRRKIGARAKILTKEWDERRAEANDYQIFNSSAMGKIYEMQIVVCHEAVADIKPVKTAVNEILDQTIMFERKYGDLPISVR